ncbi:GGGtGRT protein [Vibrio sp. LaRot3]|uniref:GGGtGRT protein n=1 Tax=Vibrio sp. LaRot3 TaxID=2998829 RepID=UPI0022CE0996|nr:GGGtGRT protein [Vibrio sp. LaRot3]MDA0148813.1 GGGtGRT protein [Vibrio sp. LaRot3]
MNTQYTPAITELLNEMQLSSLDQARQYCLSHQIDAQALVLDTQPIAFDSAAEAYTLGAALAIYRGASTAEQAALIIGEGLQAVTKLGSVAHQRQVGLGHGALAARLLNEQSQCFAFLAGHESFAAAEGAIKIALNVNKSRQSPLKVILNGLGKDAAYLISRINGFTYVRTQYDYQTGALHEIERRRFSQGPRGDILCYGADDVREGVAIMHKEQVDVSITGNSTNPTRFQHPVAGIYKTERSRLELPYFSVASGGGTGRTLHPDNVAAGPASYGMTDTLGRMHADAQFAGSSSVPAHVAMMGFIGMGNNPMVGATVALAVAIAQRERQAA